MRRAISGKRGPIVRYRDSAVSCVKTAEPIKMPLGMWIPVGPRKRVLDASAHWRHLANAIEPSMYRGDGAFLSSYFDHLCSYVFVR